MSRMPLFMFALIALVSQISQADEYQVPSQALQDVVNQNKKVTTRLSANKQWLAVLSPKSHIEIQALAKTELKLAGLRLSPEQLLPSRIKSQYISIELIDLTKVSPSKAPKKHSIRLAAANIVKVKFSPDSRFISYIGISAQGAHLYVYDIEKQVTQKLNKTKLNASLGLRYQWLHNSQGVVTNIASVNDFSAGSIDKFGPNISNTNAQKAPRRTYQDLLKNAQDDEMFAQLTQSKLTLLRLNGDISLIGQADINISYQVSPSDEYILVKRLSAPFSRMVKYYDFAQSVELFDISGKHLKTLAQLESSEFRPSGSDSVRKGPRQIHWRADKPDTLAFVKALDRGDSNAKAQNRDQLLQISAPFKEEATSLLKTPWRINKVQWGENSLAMITEKNSSKKQIRVSFFDSNKPAELKLWYQKSLRDTYADPGRVFAQRAKINGKIHGRLISIEDNALLHYGLGASPQGYQPFLKSLAINLTSAKKVTSSSETLWESSVNKLETVRYVLSRTPLKLIINRQTSENPAHLVFMDTANNTEQILYQADRELSPYKGMTRQLVTYKRADGIPLSGNLYLPGGYKKEDGPLPVLMWAYPREFKNSKVAGQVNFSPNQYSYISPKGPIPFVANGYAVFDRVAMPIIGTGKEKPNDSFRTQLIDNAAAAIDTLVDMGIADRERVAIGGHSYGAFMVANLLAHSDLFAAGIARSGAYNRSLTPFGFQYEKRNFWEAPSLYQQISPFTHADKIDEPLLIMHGEMDSNSGTYPMQSARLFKAIRGLGGNARLVTFPYESHSYKAKESILHMLWEQEQWLDKHVGHKPSAPDTAVSFH
ncbi:prolyl oligopeptidase family serine peptidase [Shewanella benthica]|uniref:alpha/beta hydrolase family protein n=1 Tax=Shewanella benthica TaxID=43661 RepID=UPI0018794C74|nr:prolyl oligopeptidase family serine peptidase [Shewanella benthica]MBE7215368.1 S9 family peptidase [Shewanella benthica]MCL1064157.1 prolyl oligopeptidase family serine peptidase [Shewanella benthica]